MNETYTRDEFKAFAQSLIPALKEIEKAVQDLNINGGYVYISVGCDGYVRADGSALHGWDITKIGDRGYEIEHKYTEKIDEKIEEGEAKDE